MFLDFLLLRYSSLCVFVRYKSVCIRTLSSLVVELLWLLVFGVCLLVIF